MHQDKSPCPPSPLTLTRLREANAILGNLGKQWKKNGGGEWEKNTKPKKLRWFSLGLRPNILQNKSWARPRRPSGTRSCIGLYASITKTTIRLYCIGTVKSVIWLDYDMYVCHNYAYLYINVHFYLSIYICIHTHTYVCIYAFLWEKNINQMNQTDDTPINNSYKISYLRGTSYRLNV